MGGSKYVKQRTSNVKFQKNGKLIIDLADTSQMALLNKGTINASVEIKGKRKKYKIKIEEEVNYD